MATNAIITTTTVDPRDIGDWQQPFNSVVSPWKPGYHKPWYSIGDYHYGYPGRNSSATNNEFDIDLFKKTFGAPKSGNYGWRVTEDDTGIRLSIDIPGVHKETLQISVTNNILTVIGLRFDMKETIEKIYDLGFKYDPKTCSASLSHGVLTLSMKKTKDASSIKIDVKEE